MDVKPSRREFIKAGGATAAAMALASPLARASEAAAEPDSFLPNIILIVIDTLRADHVGCYGYHRATTPRIDTLAKRASSYTRCVAASPWTLPTHASMFTGKYPFEHAVHTFKPAPDKVFVPPLADEHPTLAEALKAGGYQTGAIMANYMLARRYGLNRGFDTYRIMRSYAKHLNKLIFEWLEPRHTRPFFLFINYMDAHQPYNTTPRPGLLEKPVISWGLLINSLFEPVMIHKRIPQPLTQNVIDQYDTGIANADEHVGALLDWVADRGLNDTTMVVITSDHGEHFGEHYLVEHGKDVYEEAVWVPLIVKAPGQSAGRIIDGLTTSVDIPRLILSELSPNLISTYKDVFSHEPHNHTILTENYYTRSKDLFNEAWGHRFDRIRTAVYEWPYKLIRSSDGDHELYNLAKNAEESANLHEQERETATLLAQKLEQFEASRERAVPRTLEMPPLTEEERRELKALGYL